jgi:hypothetical protein
MFTLVAFLVICFCHYHKSQSHVMRVSGSDDAVGVRVVTDRELILHEMPEVGVVEIPDAELKRIDPSCESTQKVARKLNDMQSNNGIIWYCQVELECIRLIENLNPRDQIHLLIDAQLAKEYVKKFGEFTTKVETVRSKEDGVRFIEQIMKNNQETKGDGMPPVRFSVECGKRFAASVVPPLKISSCSYPSDRTCDENCPLDHPFYRADLRSCVDSSICWSLTLQACLDEALFRTCKADCQSLFELDMRKESTRIRTIFISLITLFLLGAVLGLLFAKLYWVDPLLDANEKLQHKHDSDDHEMRG